MPDPPSITDTEPGRISRAQAVQGLLSLYETPVYLEIGVLKGLTFHELRAAYKVAVDPHFRFDVAAAKAANLGAEYHEVASDVYFGEIVDPLERFDVIYLDGLHTLEQTLRDFTNALAFLRPTGVILIDDVYPSSYLASLPDFEQHHHARRKLNVADGAWMGDVYRLVFFIQTFFQQLTYRTVAENNGQLVVWADRRASVPERRVEDIARLPYERVALDRPVFNFTPFAEILAELRSTGLRA